ncbi:hypothetical protein U9M48_007409 [Paspalum notatum var. saurae]|uniref:FMP27 GFWDK domain-containing protein n=1 Tax=Paspalum notatum var. saurae TaxID=547442 RepID=A0AAQ3PWM7_PASNO
MMVGLVQLLVGFVVAWEAVELVLRHGLLLSVFKLAILAALAAAAGCVAAIFLARAVVWVLRRTAKLSIGCRSYGLNYLRDITISSPKGAVEAIHIGEIRLGLRKPITQLGFTILTHGPILQLQISDLDVELRQPVKSTNKKKPAPRKPTSASSTRTKGKSKGQAKWRLITSMASLLSLSIVELRLKAPKAAVAIKDLKIDISKTGGLDPVLGVQINIVPLFVQALESDSIENNTSLFSKLDWWVSGQYCSGMDTSDCSSFLFEDISLLCDLHQRDKGIGLKNLDLMLGPIVVNLEEKLLSKKKPSATTVTDQKVEPSVDNKSATRSEGGKLASLNKKISLFPEKVVSFNVSKLDLKFLPKDHGLSINNEIGSISLRCTKLQPQQDIGEVATHLRLETDVTDIHLLMDGATSVLEVVKVSAVISANIPTQPALPVQAEVDIKISGFQCNLIISRIKPLIRINSDKKKPLVLRESPQQEKAPKEKIALAWACTLTAPELNLVLHSLDDVPLYHCLFQSTSVSASKMVDRGTQLHAKLGELKLLVSAKRQQSMKESTSGTLLHISHSTLDLEQKDPGKDNDQAKSVISVNISGIRMHLCFYYLESLCATAISYKVFLKSILPPKKRSAQENIPQKSTKKAKGAQLLKINVAQCSIMYDGEMRLEDMSIADPKRVNFGSQGGRVVIINEDNGSPRMAYVNSTSTPDHKNVHFSTFLEIYQFGISLDKAKHSMQVELENFRLTHKEDQLNNKPVEETRLFDVRKAKFVQRSGGLNDIAACSLINVTDISVRWEPDPYLELLEVATRLKSVMHRVKLQYAVTEVKDETINMDVLAKKESPTDHGQQEKAQKKRESVIAIDLESLKISGELADGVEAMVTVGYIFSENAKIGVLVEGIAVSFCDAWIFKSSRMQLSRIPISVSDSHSDKKLQSAAVCDWVIQCRDANICLPFRLQLRAIDDAVEDTLRAFKLISAAKTTVLFPEKKSSTTSSKKSKSKSVAFRYVRIIIRDLIAEIEEEPMQGWLDEHINLMKNVFGESTVRLNLLDELSSGQNKDSPKANLDTSSEKNSNCPEVDADVPGTNSIEKLREEIYKQAFQSYYQACQKLPISEGSGACSSGFQSGFKMSTRRASVMSVCAKDVDVSLSKIDGGEEGMISFIKSVDPVCAKNDIPFSRLYGSNFSLKTRSLSAYLRDYTFPLFSGTSGKCDGRLVLGQQINNMPLQADDPAKGLALHFTKFRIEIAFSRGKQIFTFDCKREPLDLVYQGIDLHLLKVSINDSSTSKDSKVENKSPETKDRDIPGCEKGKKKTSPTEKNRDDGFFLYADYFTIRKQSPKADAARLSAWQEDGRKKSEMAPIKSEFGGDESDHDHSGSDDEGFNVVVADSCQRVFVYGLKILWNLENRAAILSWVGGLTQAFQPPKPSPSRQYTQRKILEKRQSVKEAEMPKDGALNSVSSTPQPSEPQQIKNSESPPSNGSGKPDLTSSNENALKPPNNSDSEEEGTRHFMINVVQPQFNLHSEEANGRFLLAAGSGRVMVRSFHSIVQVGQNMFEKGIGSSNVATDRTEPEMTWSRVEISVMLEHVQAHVAPTDVDPGAGIQWLPKIHRRSSEVKRTGALLERVFMPCQMYFRYTRHKGGTPELKVKPLKELTFNSPDITAGMTSRQFQVMMDVLTNLLFARTPRKQKSSLSYPLDNDDDDIEEASDAVVPDGVEEVELAKIGVEVKERARKLLLDDIRALSTGGESSHDQSQSPKADDTAWIVTGSRLMLVKQLKKRLVNVRNGRKEAYSMLRTAMQKAAQLRLMEKEKNKSPSFAMRVSMRIKKVVWSMLADGKSFSEAEINDMIFDFDRDYKDIGIAQLTTKLFVIKNGLVNAKSDTVLSPWNPPSEWGKNAMLRVNARQGAPTGGNSVIETFLVDIYPLKIYLTEAMYRMMWGYFFPGDEQQPQKRQELFKVSTTAGTRRKKSTSAAETNSPNNQSSKETAFAQKPELRRTSSFDRTWEETVAESVANELVSQLQVQSNSQLESQDTAKDSKLLRPVRSTREDKKSVDPNEVKQTRPQKMMDFRNIKISQGKKFKAKSTSQKEPSTALISASDFNLSDSDGDEAGSSDQLPAFLRKPSDGAGDGFATSVKGLFSSQKKKAMAFVLKTMKGDAEHDFHGERSENEIEFSPFARQLTITKTKKLIRRHTKKLNKSKVHKSTGTELEGPELPPRAPSGYNTDSSDSSSAETSPKG